MYANKQCQETCCIHTWLPAVFSRAMKPQSYLCAAGLTPHVKQEHNLSQHRAPDFVKVIKGSFILFKYQRHKYDSPFQ